MAIIYKYHYAISFDDQKIQGDYEGTFNECMTFINDLCQNKQVYATQIVRMGATYVED